jgi:hypothetical protein
MPFLLHTFCLPYTALYHRNLQPDRPTPGDTTLPYVQLPRSISEALENRCNFLLHPRLLLRNICLTTLTTSSSSGQKRKQADRPEKGKGRKDNKRKADVLSENDGEYDEYGYNSKNQGGEYLPWVTDVEWFNEDMGGPASVWKL